MWLLRIPIFAAPYYEAHVLPVQGGGLPEQVPGAPTAVGLVKIWFNEGGGVTFKEAVEEAKARLDQGAGGHMEALREFALKELPEPSALVLGGGISTISHCR